MSEMYCACRYYWHAKYAPEAIIIYALGDPRTGEIKYIGQTREDPYRRLLGHLRDNTDCPKTRWLNDLKEPPILIEIETVRISDGDRPGHVWCIANHREQYHIRRAARMGCPITNNHVDLFRAVVNG